MTAGRDEFLSEEDLDLANLSEEEVAAYFNLWLHQAQATNDLDAALYSHGVFAFDPAPRVEVDQPHGSPDPIGTPAQGGGGTTT